jgi:hypothetical protein
MKSTLRKIGHRLSFHPAQTDCLPAHSRESIAGPSSSTPTPHSVDELDQPAPAIPSSPGPISKGKNLGATVLCEPASPVVAISDVVLLHGVTGNAYDTWLHRPSGIHWPSMLLGSDLPTSRIIAWGYDADVSTFWGHASQNRLREHAVNLVADLACLRSETNSVRLLPSLGGFLHVPDLH